MDHEEYQRREEARWASGVATSSHNHSEGVRIQVFGKEELMAKMRADTDFDNPDPIKKVLDHAMWEAREAVNRALTLATLMMDPETAVLQAKTKESFRKAFEDAGLGPIYMKELPNEYWGKDPWAIRSPWFLVTTRLGHFKVGWRKRVINLDWSQTEKKSGRLNHLGEKDNVTFGDFYIHAYGYEKLTEYLKDMAG